VELSNGCICCTLREDLLDEVGRIADLGGYDALVIESTGISEPLPVAQTLCLDFEDRPSLADRVQVDTLITVVDAQRFLADAGSAEQLSDRGWANDGEDLRAVAQLLMDQVEFATLIVVNKTDLVTPEHLGRLERLLRDLNPGAEIVFAQHGRVPIDRLIRTQSFDLERAQASAGWARALLEEHRPESEVYGFGSWVFRARRPFHPQRLMDFLQSPLMGQVLRSKGFLWVASRPRVKVLLQTAGQQATIDPAGEWWALTPHENWPASGEARRQIERAWDAEFGDMRQEWVLIGVDLPTESLQKALSRLLLRPEEMALGEAGWLEFPDPLPSWELCPPEAEENRLAP
jgi:G3E family GTPase